ncbi:hypothetical protein BKA65DRAFT_521341 [Rhexocercosporidium sp. MPI-PUGE-AT-0058]|nr:hypothetical protein BKA65DRAFT_521341 [Rhexocercosporidium sp. MPI-PUGE-AT-0058]
METRVPLAIGWFVSMMSLMMIFMAARFYARSTVQGGLQVDDWVMAVAVILAISISILGCVATRFGLGYHVWDIRPELIVTAAKIEMVPDALIPLSMSLAKVSICLGYLRLFPTHANKIFCYVAITYLLCWGIGVALSLIFSCSPIQSHWDSTITDKSCIDFRAAIFASASLNVLSDFVVFLWPAHILWKVRVSRKRRLGLIFLFAVGFIVCVAGVARIYTFQYFFSSNDHTYRAAILWPITATEVNLSIICGCLPGIKPLLNRLFPDSPDCSRGHSNIIFGTHNRDWGLNSLSSSQTQPVLINPIKAEKGSTR